MLKRGNKCHRATPKTACLMGHTNILEIHLIQAELWQILCSTSPKFVAMAAWQQNKLARW